RAGGGEEASPRDGRGVRLLRPTGGTFRGADRRADRRDPAPEGRRACPRARKGGEEGSAGAGGGEPAVDPRRGARAERRRRPPARGSRSTAGNGGRARSSAPPQPSRGQARSVRRQ